MTYNVHSCIGRDGRISPFRIANIIAQYDPDIVALQELDVGRVRTGHIHQAKMIADHLNMDFHFHPSIEIREEQYGNAILSRYPLRMVQAGSLPTLKGRTLETRGALWTSIDVEGQAVHVVNTHLGLNGRERATQAEALLSSEWLEHPSCCSPFFICGDFNALPLSTVYRRFKAKLQDVQHGNGNRPRNTYPSFYPIFRIDHIFTSPEVVVHSIEVPRTSLTRIASDHLPLIARVSIREP